MRPVFKAVVLSLVGAVGTGCPGTSGLGTLATELSEPSVELGAFLKAGDTFTVKANGDGVVSAHFGPRQISRAVTAPDGLVATFRVEEFPEGRATLFFILQAEGRWNQSSLGVGEIWIDKSPPVLVRADATAGRDRETISVWLFDSVALHSATVTIGPQTIRHDLPQQVMPEEATELRVPLARIDEGEYVLQLQLRDRAGNEATYERDVLVDRTVPVAAFQSPLEGEVVSSELVVSVGASDNFGVASVELRASGSLIAVLGEGQSEVRMDASLFPSGPLELTAVPVDRAGNVGEPASVTVTVQ